MNPGRLAALVLCGRAAQAMAQPAANDAALLVRQAIDAGQLEADAPIQRYLPWFRVADADASQRITLRHLLNQTSGLSRADGIAPLLAGSQANIEELTRGLRSVSLNRPVGERFECSNLNDVLLAAVLQAATGRPWRELMQQRMLQALSMPHGHVDHDAAQRDGLTAVHQIVFGVPIERARPWLPAFGPTGGLMTSANDLARHLQMLLAAGQTPDPSPRRVAERALDAAVCRLRLPLRRGLVLRHIRCRGRCALAPRQPDDVCGVDGAAVRDEAGGRCADQRQ